MTDHDHGTMFTRMRVMQDVAKYARLDAWIKESRKGEPMRSRCAEDYCGKTRAEIDAELDARIEKLSKATTKNLAEVIRRFDAKRAKDDWIREYRMKQPFWERHPCVAGFSLGLAVVLIIRLLVFVWWV